MKLITGMHRSGTSLLARLVLESGGDLGDPAGFHPPDRWNPDGYYEQAVFLGVNKPLIHGWVGRFAYFRLPSRSSILRRSDRMADRIRSVAAEFSGRVVKDPRFSLTLPAWLHQGAAVRAVLICLRDPQQVALSLRRRNHVSLARGLSLWEEHNRRLLAELGNLAHRWVLYPRLLDEATFAAELRPALRLLGVPTGPEEIEAVRRRCVRRAPAVRSEPHPEGPWRALWHRLLEMHAAQEADPA